MSHYIPQLIDHFKYFGILLGAFIEGPATALISGVFVKSQFLYFFPVLLIHAFGDFSADMLYFTIGRAHSKKPLKRLEALFHFSEKQVTGMKERFRKHHLKVIFIGKLTHFLGLPAIIGIGLSGYSWKKFALFNLVATLIKSTLLISLGYSFGMIVMKGESLVSRIAIFAIILLLLLFVYYLYKRNAKKI